jgi:hypothetical protein
VAGWFEGLNSTGDTMALNWDDWEGLKVKHAAREGDLEFTKQNDIPDCIYLITNKGTIVIEAMRPEEDVDSDVPHQPGDRPWLRVRKEGQ